MLSAKIPNLILPVLDGLINSMLELKKSYSALLIINVNLNSELE